MIDLDDFNSHSKLLSESIHSRIYLYPNDDLDSPRILKLLISDSPPIQQIIHLNNEYEIGNRQGGKDIRKAYEKCLIDSRYGLVMEYIPGETVNERFLDQRKEFPQVLDAAVRISEGLGRIHEKGIIHKDINGSNILIGADNGDVKFIDFGLSSLFNLKSGNLGRKGEVAGTLKYISPEQSGRMNLVVDHRSDLYSLGILLFEMLTGQLPFSAEDSLELLHCHIALKPVRIEEIDPSLPPILSDIVDKLLAKDPNDRYQNAKSLAIDLGKCLSDVRKGATSQFQINYDGGVRIFRIPQKLYGRDGDIHLVSESFSRAARGGWELLMVSGYSGIGKSSLVQKADNMVSEKGGVFLSGKYDQYRNIPYEAFVQAFSGFIQQVMGMSNKDYLIWKERIQSAVGRNGQIIIDIIPELEQLLGKQPDVPHLGPVEMKNRFNWLMGDFLRAFTAPGKPLVLFLDDLQWVDAASLQLLEIITADSRLSNLFVIGAYRDNEVNSDHPLSITLKRIREGMVLNEILLKPLNRSDVTLLISETLNQSTSLVEELAKLVTKKTEGNPFFVNEFLYMLHDKGYICHSKEGAHPWFWNIEQIEELNITSNVVDLLLDKFRTMDEDMRRLLMLASFLGNEFTLENLTLVFGGNKEEAYDKLIPAIHDGFIIPLAEEKLSSANFTEARNLYGIFAFRHDRIQQAAYSLSEEGSREELHLAMGRKLLEAHSDKVFHIVDHLNRGAVLITDEEEKLRVSELNYNAGVQGKEALAYESALRYMRSGRSVMPEKSWENHFELMYKLSLGTLEMEYQNCCWDKAVSLSYEMMEQAKTVLQKVQILELQILYFISQNQMTNAIERGIYTLELLGVVFPKRGKETRKVIRTLKGKLPDRRDDIKGLVDLPPLSDPEAMAKLKILTAMSSAAYNAGSEIWPLIILMTVDLCVEWGDSSLAAPAFSWYGALLCGLFSEIEVGYEYGKLSLNILEKYNCQELVPKVNDLYNVFVRTWKEHAYDVALSLDEAIITGREMGDLEYAFYAAAHQGNYKFFCGCQLSETIRLMDQNIKLTSKHKFEFHENFIRIFRQSLEYLTGNIDFNGTIDGTYFREEERLPSLIENRIAFLVLCVYTMKSMLSYLYGDYEAAAEAGKRGLEFRKGATGTFYYEEHLFYYSLALLRTMDRNDKKLQKQVEENLKELRIWSEAAPMNFLHRYYLVRAEKARLEGDIQSAMGFYKMAMGESELHRYPNIQALANECYGRFWRDLGEREMSSLYLKKALELYSTWGATVKVSALVKEFFPETGEKGESCGLGLSLSDSDSVFSDGGELDMFSFIKTMQILSGEMNFNLLCRKLLDIVLQNVGAEVGYLILEKEGTLSIKAKGTVEGDAILMDSYPLIEADYLSREIVQYTARTQKPLLLDDATRDGSFTQSEYIQKTKPKSVLTYPLIHQNQLRGLIYLENNLSYGAFSRERLDVLNLISSQITISLENAALYEDIHRQARELGQLNEKLTDSEENMEITLNSIGDGVIATDGQGNITRINPVAAELTGFSQEKAIGLHLDYVFKLVNGESNLPMETPLRRVLREKRIAKLENDTMLISKKREKIYVASSGSPILSDKGDLVGMVLVFRNISREKQVEQQLRQSEKMQAIGQLAGGIAHDFNNMLGGILGAADLLSSKFQDNEVAMGYIDIIKMATERASVLTEKLLVFSRKGKQNFENLDCHRIIEESLGIIEHSIDKKISITKNLNAKDISIRGNQSQLQNGIINLCVNARDAMPHGGELSIVTSNKVIDEVYNDKNFILQPGTYIQIAIKDTGTGIPREIQSRIFEPFFTTKEVGKGTGLGLAAVFGMVKDHKGDIQMNSETGKGTQFKIFLPVQNIKTEGVDKKETILKGAGTILLVDDEKLIRLTASAMLKELGYHVILGVDGLDGLEKFKENRDSIDLVILDMVMPHMNGKETFLEIRKLDSNVKFILSSGFFLDSEVNAMKEEGLRNLIMKPYTKEDMSRLIHDVLHSPPSSS